MTDGLKHSMSLVVPNEVYDILVQMAREDNRSLNSYVNMLFCDIVNDYLSSSAKVSD